MSTASNPLPVLLADPTQMANRAALLVAVGLVLFFGGLVYFVFTGLWFVRSPARAAGIGLGGLAALIGFVLSLAPLLWGGMVVAGLGVLTRWRNRCRSA
jgi:hypothetical protein